MNKIAWLEFEPTYYNAAVQHINDNATMTISMYSSFELFRLIILNFFIGFTLLVFVFFFLFYSFFFL